VTRKTLIVLVVLLMTTKRRVVECTDWTVVS
jgi:hypothetical protein